MQLGKREKHRALLSLMLAFGLWHMCDQWSRVLQPFLQWQLKPRAEAFHITALIALGNAFILLGTLLVAHLIDSVGCRAAAVVLTVITACYHLLISQIGTFVSFSMAQSLLVANHFTMVSEAFIAVIVGADGDERERTRLLLRLTIPLGLSLVAGPWMAVQVMYHIHPSLHLSQAACGVVLLVVVIPVVLFLLPEPTDHDRRSALTTPSLHVYADLLRNRSLRWTLLFTLLVSGPYFAYDQLSRTHMASRLLSNPWDMSHLLILLGVSTLVTNLFLIGPLQRRFTSQRLVQIALVILTVSYLYLSQVSEYHHLLIGMPVQIVGICIAFSELSAQIMGAAPKQHVGKAAGLNRAVQLVAGTMTPLIAGYYISPEEGGLLCYFSAALSIVAFAVVHKFGGFMNAHSRRLPLGHQD